MKALVLSEYNRLEVLDLPQPTAAPGELLIRVQACGICGSDVHGYDGSTGRRIPPIVMGHEAAGIVEAVGNNVTGFAPGDRVTFDSTIYCGKCFFCQRGQVNLCDDREVIGVSTPAFRRMGAFAEFVTVPARIAYHLPADMPFAHAALIEAVSVAVHAVSLTPITLNDTALVIGAGMIGLLTLQAVRLAGAGNIIVVDVDDTRLALARELGATHTFNMQNEGAFDDLMRLTNGRGVDVALECVGTTATVKNAIDAVRKGGAVTLVGNITPTIEVGLQSVVTRQIRLQGSCASAGEYPACIALMSRGDIRVDKLLSAVAPLSDGPAWFDRLYHHEPGLLKVVLQPNANEAQ
ncbi:MAG: galactitol-1-phosphate 5-dehydrogenase [Acidobacteria bacterium]|nr:galactitol-1-phosphate 5-dehydrogenase [Acidobacteriota bacterium]